MTETNVIGVVGLGELGTVAATALKRGGYQVVGFDPSPAAQQRMKDLGVEIAADPAEVGRR